MHGADLVVYTVAILPDNPERVELERLGLPSIERATLLGQLMEGFDTAIGVCGAHGKTTTTSMLSQVLMECGMDPSAVVGGKLPAIGGSGRLGSSDIMTCEACEFVDTFLKLYPDIAVLLNIDADHLDYFGTVENIIRSFHKFAENTSKVVIYNGDDEKTCKAVEGITGKELITFGEKEGNDYVATNIVHVSGLETHFDVLYHGELLGTVVLHIAGVHNVLNALAAIAAVRYVGISFRQDVRLRRKSWTTGPRQRQI